MFNTLNETLNEMDFPFCRSIGKSVKGFAKLLS